MRMLPLEPALPLPMPAPWKLPMAVRRPPLIVIHSFTPVPAAPQLPPPMAGEQS